MAPVREAGQHIAHAERRPFQIMIGRRQIYSVALLLWIRPFTRSTNASAFADPSAFS